MRTYWLSGSKVGSARAGFDPCAATALMIGRTRYARDKFLAIGPPINPRQRAGDDNLDATPIWLRRMPRLGEELHHLDHQRTASLQSCSVERDSAVDALCADHATKTRARVSWNRPTNSFSRSTFAMVALFEPRFVPSIGSTSISRGGAAIRRSTQRCLASVATEIAGV